MDGVIDAHAADPADAGAGGDDQHPTQHDPPLILRAFQAFEGGDLPLALAQFQAAVDAAPAPPGDLLEMLGLCQAAIQSAEDAIRTFTRAFTAFNDAGDARGAVRIAAHLICFHQALGADAAASGWEARALRLLSRMPPCVERGYLAIARVSCDVRDPRDLLERAELALTVADEFGDHDLELRALADKGLALVCLGTVSAGFTLLDEVMVAATAGELRSPDMLGKSLCAMLSACERTADIPRAEYWCRRVEEEPRWQHPILTTHCSVVVGVIDGLRGRWESAETRLASAVQGSEAQRVDSTAKLAELLLQQGRLKEAAALLQGFEDKFETMPALGRLRAAEGRYGEAAALLRATARALGEDCFRLASVLTLLIEVELQQGNPSAAQRAVERLQQLDARCESNEIRALARLGAGRVARHRGDARAALEELETALALLLHYDRPLLTAQVRLELATALATADPAAALVEADAALAAFRRLGLSPRIEAAEKLRAAVATSVPPAQEAGPPAARDPGRLAGPSNGLTQRESEIAYLVAQGLTNREIAQRLVLSVRTVETHVDRILGKFDFHTRTQLAAWLGAEGPVQAANT